MKRDCRSGYIKKATIWFWLEKLYHTIIIHYQLSSITSSNINSTSRTKWSTTFDFNCIRDSNRCLCTAIYPCQHVQYRGLSSHIAIIRSPLLHYDALITIYYASSASISSISRIIISQIKVNGEVPNTAKICRIASLKIIRIWSYWAFDTCFKIKKTSNCYWSS